MSSTEEIIAASMRLQETFDNLRLAEDAIEQCTKEMLLQFRTDIEDIFGEYVAGDTEDLDANASISETSRHQRQAVKPISDFLHAVEDCERLQIGSDPKIIKCFQEGRKRVAWILYGNTKASINEQ